jgi:hypothetical protein
MRISASAHYAVLESATILIPSAVDRMSTERCPSSDRPIAGEKPTSSYSSVESRFDYFRIADSTAINTNPYTDGSVLRPVLRKRSPVRRTIDS